MVVVIVVNMLCVNLNQYSYVDIIVASKGRLCVEAIVMETR